MEVQRYSKTQLDFPIKSIHNTNELTIGMKLYSFTTSLFSILPAQYSATWVFTRPSSLHLHLLCLCLPCVSSILFPEVLALNLSLLILPPDYKVPFSQTICKSPQERGSLREMPSCIRWKQSISSHGNLSLALLEHRKLCREKPSCGLNDLIRAFSSGASDFTHLFPAPLQIRFVNFSRQE